MRVGQLPKCGCGKSKHPDQLCDGSHSQLTPDEVQALNQRYASRTSAKPLPSPADNAQKPPAA